MKSYSKCHVKCRNGIHFFFIILNSFSASSDTFKIHKLWIHLQLTINYVPMLSNLFGFFSKDDSLFFNSALSGCSTPQINTSYFPFPGPNKKKQNVDFYKKKKNQIIKQTFIIELHLTSLDLRNKQKINKSNSELLPLFIQQFIL